MPLFRLPPLPTAAARLPLVPVLLRLFLLSLGLPLPVLAQAPSADVQTLLQWRQQAADNIGAPFMVIDKKQARVWVYGAAAQPLGSAPVLLGAAVGDDSVPGIGERAIEAIQPAERTTPAGRFVVEPGHNAAGEAIFWIDYDAAVSMHRVRASSKPAERRLQRLATPTPADNRISYGCINVPAAFFGNVIQPLFMRQRGVVYVLPETRPLQALLAQLAQLASRQAALPALQH